MLGIALQSWPPQLADRSRLEVDDPIFGHARRRIHLRLPAQVEIGGGIRDLDEQTLRLVKLGIALGAQADGVGEQGGAT